MKVGNDTIYTKAFVAEYEAHHAEFEQFLKDVGVFTVEVNYRKLHDIGYYVDNWTQGAWIAWLYTTGKRKVGNDTKR